MKTLVAFSMLLLSGPAAHSQNGWTILDSGTSEDLWGMADFPVPVATGDGGTALWDPNGQPTWTPIGAPPGHDYRFYKSAENPTDNWLLSADGTILFTDQGLTGGGWVDRSVPGYSGVLHGLFRSNWLVGDNGLLANWEDPAGPDAYWNIHIGITTADLYSGGEIPNTVLAVGSGGTCVRSIDDGTTWSYPDMQTSEDLLGMHLINSTSPSAVAVGRGGVIRVSTDLGATWTIANSGVTTDLYSVFGYLNTWFACGAGGIILRSGDQGVTWTQESVPTTEDLYYIDAYYDYTFGPYCVGANGTILHTSGSNAHPVGVEELTAEKAQLQCYPQPANDHLTVEGNITGNALVQLFASDGREVFRSIQQGNGMMKVSLDVQSLPPGIYGLCLSDDQGERRARVELYH